MAIKIATIDISLNDAEQRGISFFEPDNKLLEPHGIIVCKNESDADLLVSDHFNELGIRRNLILRKMLKYGKQKKYLLWTNEPRYSKFFKSYWSFPGLPKLHILNIYTGLLTHNFLWGPLDIKLPLIDRVSLKNRKIVALMRYRNDQKKWSLKYQGRELDLCFLRTQIALEGHKLGVIDIYGQGWNPKIRKGVSRTNNYQQIKQNILEKYHFNLAFENTNFPYYCTEKIWDSIQGYCLPIYYGKNNTIYEDFPKKSFIDYCDFNNFYELFDYIQSISSEEFVHRMNLCINVFNESVHKRRLLGKRQSMWDITIQKIKNIMEV